MAETFTPTPTHLTGESAASEIPRVSEGFLVVEHGCCHPLGELSVASAVAEHRMPTDPETGLPYPLLPHDDMDTEVNYHHHFYNRRHPDLEGDYPLTAGHLSNPEDIPLPIIAGLSVRISRGQLLPIEQHRMAHKLFSAGPDLPHELDEKFVTTLKACSGVVSRFALDVTAQGKRQFVYMDDELFAKVASPRVLCTERVYYDKPANHRRRILGNFFLRYAANQDLSHISRRVVDEFLHTSNDEKRIELGNFILRQAVDVSIEPVVPIYKDLKDRGFVQPGRPELRSTVWKYVHPNRRDRVHRVLRKKLAKAA